MTKSLEKFQVDFVHARLYSALNVMQQYQPSIPTCFGCFLEIVINATTSSNHAKKASDDEKQRGNAIQGLTQKISHRNVFFGNIFLNRLRPPSRNRLQLLMISMEKFRTRCQSYLERGSTECIVGIVDNSALSVQTYFVHQFLISPQLCNDRFDDFLRHDHAERAQKCKNEFL